jgi:hypothetical protein
MGRFDVMESQDLVDCYFSPLLHHRMVGQETVIFINIFCWMMRDSPFLVTQVPYSRMAMLESMIKNRDPDPEHHYAQTPDCSTLVYWP